MFALRDAGTDESVLALASVFTTPPVCKTPSPQASPYHSALLKHEVAFVLGQLQNAKAMPALKQALADSGESAMVRHEAAEALGAIAENVFLFPLLFPLLL
jgi:deoxyhypusine monooxygenase